MTWDFRNMIRRGGGQWPRDWRLRPRPAVRPPAKPKPEARDQKSGNPDEHWLTPSWQPPEGSADAWKNLE